MSGGNGVSGPNAELARIVVQALVAADLIQPKRADELETKMVAGKMKPEDWVEFVGMEVWNLQEEKVHEPAS